ncbi:MAG TPA: MoxR family ATPase [Saprospiraceae bacterium]|nr:ATPase [Saprospirales bacterium]HRQ31122.1 MoxR family ATPase [Saprospiraceae bacterium]
MDYSFDIELLSQEVKSDSVFVQKILTETSRVIVGQEYMIERLMLGLLANGHVLLEGLPGLAKTLAISTLASAMDVKFHRIQFTPDLLPSDIIGTMVYNPAKADFFVSKGPVFANFILADEINRAPAKVQSALLEAMQERQVSIGSTSYLLEEPFLVLATQNPIEQEGTYPLPEAQVDRFMLKVKIGYPRREEEKEIIRRSISGETSQKINQVADISSIIKARETVRKIYMDEKIHNYILDIVFATRQPELFGLSQLKPLIAYGASPRASIALSFVAKAFAYMKQRAYVIPEDIRNICKDVLRHRIGLSYEAEAENISPEELISQIINKIEVP